MWRRTTRGEQLLVIPDALVVAFVLAVVALLSGCGSQPNPTRPVRTTTAQTTTARLGPTTTTPTRPLETAPQPATSQRASVVKPPVVWDPIPFGPERKAEMAAYAERHYGLSTFSLIDPRVIVIHYTETPDFQSTYNTFAADTPDSELHELPNTCAHFVIDGAGVIHQLVRVDIMCRHTVGLNWTAIGIEHVAYSDQQVLNSPQQMTASLKLVRWLRCRFQIPINDVIGHNESLNSPYHHENVPALRTQTHNDFNRADMQTYRAQLRAAGPC